jgi:hypothetical protein
LQGLNHPFKCIVDYQSYTTNPQWSSWHTKPSWEDAI